MNAKELGKCVERAATEWPVGAMVWHRADGKRGVVVEYAVQPAGVTLVVCFGGGADYDKCRFEELSTTKVVTDGDDDEWRNGEGVGE